MYVCEIFSSTNFHFHGDIGLSIVSVQQHILAWCGSCQEGLRQSIESWKFWISGQPRYL